MDTATSNISAVKNGKYDKDLAELESLKNKAKSEKPKVIGSYFVQNVLITCILFLILFFIGFYFSYLNTKRKIEIQSAQFIPKAEINLPINNRKCVAVFDVGQPISADLQNHSLNCLGAKTKVACEQIDQYNEINKDLTGPDGKADCKWSD